MGPWVSLVIVFVSTAADGGNEPAPTFAEPMTRPVPVTPIDWSYPAEARANNPRGTIILKCVISEGGEVEGCDVLRSLPGVTQWAIDKLRAARFRPVTLEGRAVRISYVFNILIHPAGEARPKVQRARWRPPPSPEILRACTGPNAAVCRDVAMSFLHPDGGAPDFDRVGQLLTAACNGKLEQACTFLDEAFRPPQLISGVPTHEIGRGPGDKGIVVCRITVEGTAKGCWGPGGPVSDWFIARMLEAKFLPATFQGAPFETEHAIRYSFQR
jgi:protein TonB